MKTYNISRSYKVTLGQSRRTRKVADTFAIAEMLSARKVVVENMPITIASGTVTSIVGPSGSGKTTILRTLKANLVKDQYRVADLGTMHFNRALPLVDCLGDVPLGVAMKLLSSVGLSEAALMIDSYDHLSAGQQYRFRLVRALADKPEVIIADEFCNCLDDISAAVISCNIRRIVDKTGTCFIAAGVSESCHDFLLPDTIIRKSLGTGFNIEQVGGKQNE